MRLARTVLAACIVYLLRAHGVIHDDTRFVIGLVLAYFAGQFP